MPRDEYLDGIMRHETPSWLLKQVGLRKGDNRMEKYAAHGLTRAEDDILGGFGREPDLSDTLELESLSPDQREAVKSLIRQELLETHQREDSSTELRLTPKGKKLFRVREAEESEVLGGSP